MNAIRRPSAPGWLFVLPWSIRHLGGVNQVVKSLFLEFQRGGVLCPYLLAGADASDTEVREAGLMEPPLRVDLWSPIDHDHPFRAWISFFCRLPHRCWALRKIIKKYGISVINPHFPDLASLVFLVLKRTKLFDGEIVLSFHQSDIICALSTKGTERKLWRILLRGADHIVVVSRDSAASILKINSSIAEKLVTVPNGVDLGLFCPQDSGEPAHDLSSPQDKMIVSVGKFTLLKGHGMLIRAFGHLVESMPDARLVIVGGDGPEFEPLRRLIDSLALSDKISLCKDVPHEQIPAVLSQAHLFVLASRQEGHPLAVVEAGAAGLPIICTEGSWSQELISDGVTGRLVAPEDERALASAMADLLTNKKVAQQMAARFHEYVQKNLTWEQSYKKYADLGREAAGRFPHAGVPSTAKACVGEKTVHEGNDLL